LIAEERLLSNEVQALSDKIEIWSTQRPGQQRSDSVPPPGSARKFDTSNSNLLPEIIEYDVSDLTTFNNIHDFSIYSVFYLNMVEQQEIGMTMTMEHFYEFEISIRVKTYLLMIVSVFYQLKLEIKLMNMKNGIDNF
jgi:hypothetical protein